MLISDTEYTMETIPLIDYSALNKNTFNDVYEPAEDTFLLIDALEKDIVLLKKLRPTICLEIGSGSGVVISSLAKVFNGCCYLSVDINPLAALATKTTSESNGISVNVIVSDLVTVLEDRLQNSVDLLIFNPPYVVTPSEEVGKDNIFCATSGGRNGREVMDRLFPLLPKLLSKTGFFYLICVAENDINDIEHCLEKYGLKMVKVLERRCGREHLFALRFSFTSSPPVTI